MTDQHPHPLTGTAGALQALERTRKENRKAMERLSQPMTHPLTDEILATFFGKGDRSLTVGMRLARSAADWQLEQVIKCISTTLMDAYLYVDDSRDYAFNEGEFLKDLKKAMRPQEDN